MTLPVHVASTWIGHSLKVSQVSVTDDHFTSALQNPVQSTAAFHRNPSQTTTGAQEGTPILQGVACSGYTIGTTPRPRGRNGSTTCTY